MAKIYKDFDGNLMSFAKSFARLNGQPLDKSEIWYDLAKAQEYAATEEAYVGQILAVIDSDSNKVVFYGIQDAAGTLKEIGSAFNGDELSTEIVNGTIQLKNFGKEYYAYIPAVKNEETGEIIEASKYVLTEGFKDNLEPRVIADGENYIIAWYERNDEDIQIITNTINKLQEQIGIPATEDNVATGLYESLENLTNAINEKANAKDVYTKQEINEAIASAVTNSNHLKRIVVDSIDDIDIYAEDALNYIYMAPTGLQLDDNKYDEYIIIEFIINDDETNEEVLVRRIEKVGSWEVNLDQYVKVSEFEELERTVETNKTTVDQAIALKADKSTSLSGYGIIDAYTKEEVNTKIEDALKVATGGESASDVLVQLNNYKESNDAKVKDIEDNLAKLEGAEKNFISDVDSNFTVAEGQLQLNNIEISKVDGLETVLNNKVEVVQGSRLINSNEIQLLQDLANGQFDNFITAVDTDIFSVTNGSLYLEQVPVASLYNALGDFSTLPHANEENYTLVKEINNLYSMLTWNDML